MCWPRRIINCTLTLSSMLVMVACVTVTDLWVTADSSITYEQFHPLTAFFILWILCISCAASLILSVITGTCTVREWHLSRNTVDMC